LVRKYEKTQILKCSMDINRFKLEILPLKDKLYRFASRLLEDQEEAQDAVQEVFMKLWNLQTKLDELNSVEAFAMKITKNHCLDRIKSRRTVSIEQTKSLLYNSDEQAKIERDVEVKDDVNYIKHLISQLPEQQRAIIQMRDIEGYDFEEIEEALELNVNTIRVNLSRARKRIREMYLNTINDETRKNSRFIG
jgi:RNA polymerase sigma factor (sigma-70 family)